MKKTLYIISVCCLFVLIIHEFKANITENETSSNGDLPTARFFAEVNAENKEVGQKIAYLTFDDGPSEVTPSILQTLKEENVKATFFVVGEKITEGREDIIREEVKEGHSIGVHTDSHVRQKIYASKEQFFEDFYKAYTKIEQITGSGPNLHRFPWGSNNNNLKSFYSSVHNSLSQMGIRSFDWNCSGDDSIGNPTEYSILSHIKKDYIKFDDPIILLHDSNASEKTALALKDVIKMIKADGYHLAH